MNIASRCRFVLIFFSLIAVVSCSASPRLRYGLKQDGANVYELSGRCFDSLLENPSLLFDGFELLGDPDIESGLAPDWIYEDHLLAALGMRAGDVIVTIGGASFARFVENPELYGRISLSGKVSVGIERKGSLRSITIIRAKNSDADCVPLSRDERFSMWLNRARKKNPKTFRREFNELADWGRDVDGDLLHFALSLADTQSDSRDLLIFSLALMGQSGLDAVKQHFLDAAIEPHQNDFYMPTFGAWESSEGSANQRLSGLLGDALSGSGHAELSCMVLHGLCNSLDPGHYKDTSRIIDRALAETLIQKAPSLVEGSCRDLTVDHSITGLALDLTACLKWASFSLGQ